MRQVFDAAITPTFEEFSEHGGRFNLAPSQPLPIIRLNRQGRRTLSGVSWGLIPSWTSGTPKVRPINARGETVATSGMYRDALQRRRCLVPADGFYEWQEGQGEPKQPYFLHRQNHEFFAFAGLWERWQPEGGGAMLDTFTIVTTTATPTLSAIHPRMPVILQEADFDRWLDPKFDGAAVADLIKSYEDPLTTYTVGNRVNSVKNDDPSLVEPAISETFDYG